MAKTYTLTYLLKNDQGIIIERVSTPVQLKIGNHTLPIGLESAITHMRVGETKTITLMPEEAFGTYDETRLFQVSQSELPYNQDILYDKALEFDLKDKNGPFVIRDYKDGIVTLDTNHPLAGKTLTYEITLHKAF